MSEDSSSTKGNTHPKQNPTYKKYVILERMGVDAVIRCLDALFVLLKFKRKCLIWIKNEKEPDS